MYLPTPKELAEAIINDPEYSEELKENARQFLLLENLETDAQAN